MCEIDQGESWEKVAVILATVDRSLGIDINVAISNAKQVGSTKVCFDRIHMRAHVHHTIHTKANYVYAYIQYTDVPDTDALGV